MPQVKAEDSNPPYHSPPGSHPAGFFVPVDWREPFSQQAYYTSQHADFALTRLILNHHQNYQNHSQH